MNAPATKFVTLTSDSARDVTAATHRHFGGSGNDIVVSSSSDVDSCVVEFAIADVRSSSSSSSSSIRVNNEHVARASEPLSIVAVRPLPSPLERLRVLLHRNRLPLSLAGTLCDYRCADDIEHLKIVKRRRRRRKNTDDADDEEPLGIDLDELAAADDAELVDENNQYVDWDDLDNDDDHAVPVPDTSIDWTDVEADVDEACTLFKALDHRNPVVEVDAHVALRESDHTYFVGGCRVVNASTTTAIKEYFTEFNVPEAVRSKVNGRRWATGDDPHYRPALAAAMNAWIASPLSLSVDGATMERALNLMSGTSRRCVFVGAAVAAGIDVNIARSIVDIFDTALVAYFDAEWERNRDLQSRLGTEMHTLIERFYRRLVTRDDLTRLAAADQNHPELLQFLAFHDDVIVGRGNDPGDETTWDYEPFRVELCTYDDKTRLCGAIDGIFRNRRTGRFRDWDWKRSKEIATQAYDNRMGTHIFAQVPDSNFWPYTIQQNMYGYYVDTVTKGTMRFDDVPDVNAGTDDTMVAPYAHRLVTERHRELRNEGPVTAMGLAVFHPNQTTYQVFPVPDATSLITAFIDDRHRIIATSPQLIIERALRPLMTPTLLHAWTRIDDDERVMQARQMLANEPTITEAPALIGIVNDDDERQVWSDACAHVVMCTQPSIDHLTRDCACRTSNKRADE